jgi:hypothetical protein
MTHPPPDDPTDDIVSSRGEIALYATEDGRSRVECRFDQGTLWLSQAAMVELYQTTKPNISMHLKAIFAEGELEERAVVKHFLTTALDGKTYQVGHYHLDAVLAVGYRVRSPRGTQFRRWATERLREYLVKGFVMDDQRLADLPGPGVPDHLTSSPSTSGASCPARARGDVRTRTRMRKGNTTSSPPGGGRPSRGRARARP